jgi:hypothetical protein
MILGAGAVNTRAIEEEISEGQGGRRDVLNYHARSSGRYRMPMSFAFLTGGLRGKDLNPGRRAYSEERA